MYCPSCGSEDRQRSQFCRACGTDLRIVRNTLENPDEITQSAISAREHIGMAIADKIRQMKTGKDLEHIAEDVLPQFEKFLESPEERRLRRIRAGVITASIGFGASFNFLVLAMYKIDLIPVITPFFVTFLIGLGMIINGLLFTLPRKSLPGDVRDALDQRMLDAGLTKSLYEAPVPANLTNELPAANNQQPMSIAEHTTHHLKTGKT